VSREPNLCAKVNLTLRIARAGALLLISVPFCSLLAAPQEISEHFDKPAAIVSGSNDTSVVRRDFVGDAACQSCHEDKFKTFLETRHHRTSQLPSETSIAGKFSPGGNRMKTFNPELSFRMDAKNGHFYQTATLAKSGHTTVRSEQFDIVVGSGKKGQTYLYWKDARLFELPVSYWTDLKRWVNSPGYVDGSADFERPVIPRCVECHATYFQARGPSPADNAFNRSNFVLGISCERCHGPGSSHVQQRGAIPSRPNAEDRSPGKTMAPIGLTREEQLDICAQCHGGVGDEIAPAFSFVPGKRLSEYIKLGRPTPDERVDVHGNQVALLEKSRCFQSSPAMTCSVCHDPHAPERPAASYSDRCITCHQPPKCGLYATLGPQIASNCVDCHMPVQASRSLVFDDADNRIGARVRNHWIRVYPENRALPNAQ
jgi:Cytochrome c554 and c-prime